MSLCPCMARIRQARASFSCKLIKQSSAKNRSSCVSESIGGTECLSNRGKKRVEKSLRKRRQACGPAVLQRICRARASGTPNPGGHLDSNGRRRGADGRGFHVLRRDVVSKTFRDRRACPNISCC